MGLNRDVIYLCLSPSAYHDDFWQKLRTLRGKIRSIDLSTSTFNYSVRSMGWRRFAMSPISRMSLHEEIRNGLNSTHGINLRGAICHSHNYSCTAQATRQEINLPMWLHYVSFNYQTFTILLDKKNRQIKGTKRTESFGMPKKLII